MRTMVCDCGKHKRTGVRRDAGWPPQAVLARCFTGAPHDWVCRAGELQGLHLINYLSYVISCHLHCFSSNRFEHCPYQPSLMCAVLSSGTVCLRQDLMMT